MITARWGLTWLIRFQNTWKKKAQSIQFGRTSSEENEDNINDAIGSLDALDALERVFYVFYHQEDTSSRFKTSARKFFQRTFRPMVPMRSWNFRTCRDAVSSGPLKWNALQKAGAQLFQHKFFTELTDLSANSPVNSSWNQSATHTRFLHHWQSAPVGS